MSAQKESAAARPDPAGRPKAKTAAAARAAKAAGKAPAAAEALPQANAAAEQLTDEEIQADMQRLIGCHAMEIIHDLRAPVAALQANLQLWRMRLQKTGSAEDLRRLELLEKLARTIGDRSGQFMELQRSKPSEAQLHPLDPLRVMEQVQEMLHSLLLLRRVDCRLCRGPGAGPALAEEQMLKTIYINLLDNAVHAMPQGGSFCVTLSGSKGIRRIELADNGCGMEPDTLARIFTRGFTTRPDGNGFGLAICRLLAERMHGELHAESAPGQGTRFILTLAAAALPEEERPPL